MTFTANITAGSKVRASVLAALCNERTPIAARVASNQALTTSSTTLQNITDLVVTPPISQIYRIELIIFVSGASGTAEDVKIGFTFPSGWSLRIGGIGATTSLTGITATDMNVQENSVTSGSTTFPYGVSTNSTIIRMAGHLDTSSTAGNLQIQAAQNTSGANAVTILAGSLVELRQML